MRLPKIYRMLQDNINSCTLVNLDLGSSHRESGIELSTNYNSAHFWQYEGMSNQSSAWIGWFHRWIRNIDSEETLGWEARK